VLFLSPIVRYRRKLHVQKPSKGGLRKNYGGTRSVGIERGTLVKHRQNTPSLLGGNSVKGISLHNISTNKRFFRTAKKVDLKILTNMKWSISNV